jgi:dTDP-4-dehydrorhamnose reductase/UDP-glucose 4-epimerase
LTVLVVGGNSYLAQEFLARHPDLHLRAVGHSEVQRESAYADAASVVNFAFAPALHDADYDAALDIDAQAARMANAAGAHYVMISSRRVYPEAGQWNASELTEASGKDAYGRNKARIERNLQALMGDRLTILRPGSVVGFEPVPGRQRIAAYLQNQLLREGRIRLTVAPRTRRDLVPVDFFCRVLKQVVQRRIPGTFNVGSGAATAVGDAARWLIEGYGSGKLVAESTLAADEFQLESAKLTRAYGLSCTAGEVRENLQESGRRLARSRP